MTMGDRIKQARLARGLKQKQLERISGVSQQMISKLEKGTAHTTSHLVRIARALRTDAWWLQTGEGESNLPDRVDRYGAFMEEAKPDDDDAVREPPPGARVAVWETLEDLPEGGRYVQVPHYDVLISAGDGCTWVDHPDNEPLVFRASWFRSKGSRPEDCRAIYVNGESMVPTLKHGDTVLIDTSRTAVRDDVIYAVLYADELYIKRLFRLPGGGLELRSDNPRHPSREVQGVDVEQVRVLGEMIWRAG